MRFKELRDPMTQEISTTTTTTTTTMMLMLDEQGVVWTVPIGAGHRFEQQYEEWVAAGNTIEAADTPGG
jgi:hypothetical protein